MLRVCAQILLAFVALYPIVTSAFWIAGGLLFRLFDEANDAEEPPGGWPGVTVLIPAYNEEAVIANCVSAALGVDYGELEILVLDDGSTDETVAAAERAARGDPRLEVIRDPVNRGKADRLNIGFRRARHELVVVCDADTHLHPLAVKLLVSRMLRSPLIGAVAGSPHVTNRRSLLAGLQFLETASIIGLIRRTWALVGRVGVVAGVLGLFRREAVLSVGGYDGRMATEDIDLSWRLLLAGWHTAFEPRGPRRHGGALDHAVALGPAVPMGARPGRGPEHPHANGCAMAQPADVAARGRGLGLARLGDRDGVRPRGGAGQRDRRRTVRDTRFRHRLGHRDRGHRRDSARVRARRPAPIRPPRQRRVPSRPALSDRLLGDLRGRRASSRGTRGDQRPARGAGRLGHRA